VVLDTSGYYPRVVWASAELLSGRVGLYVFVSTISVYADLSAPGLKEDAPVAAAPDPTVEEFSGQTYGPLKVLCEDEVRRALPGQALIVRPGPLVGPYDPSDRFTYWPLRVARGGEALAPAGPGYPVQFIDARDLAAWLLDLGERRQTGTYHATSPVHGLTFGAVLEACRLPGGQDAGFTWVAEEFLLSRGVSPWTELPLWVTRDRLGMVAVDCSKAIGAGLQFRPPRETARDTLAWAMGPGRAALRAGLEPERERELLREWHARGTSPALA
jgi:2'-hydroxyisoflavone reductase